MTHQRFAVSCNESAVPLSLLGDDSVEVESLLVLSLVDPSLGLLQKSVKLGKIKFYQQTPFTVVKVNEPVMKQFQL